MKFRMTLLGITLLSLILTTLAAALCGLAIAQEKLNYPNTAQVAHTDNYHGVTISRSVSLARRRQGAADGEVDR